MSYETAKIITDEGLEEGVVEHQHVGPQLPLGRGTLQAFAGAVAEPLGAGDLGTGRTCPVNEISPIAHVVRGIGFDFAALANAATIARSQPGSAKTL